MQIVSLKSIKQEPMDSSRFWNFAEKHKNRAYQQVVYQETYAVSIFFTKNKLHFQLDVSIAIEWKFLFQEATLYDHPGLYL